MVAKELMTSNMPTIKTSNSGVEALSLMDEYKISHLPIVNNSKLLGIISDTDIFNLKMPEEPIGNHNLALESTYCFENDHLYLIAEVMERLKLSVLPIVSSEIEYLGAIEKNILTSALFKMLSLAGPGGIVCLNVKEVNYSMVEISRIVEDGGAKILSSSVVVDYERLMYIVTLKLNREDITSAIKAFERYGYNVESWYMDNGMLDSVLQERYDSLVRFLDV